MAAGAAAIVGDLRGRFGPGTQAAVVDFQRHRGLPASGVCDTATWMALVEAGYRAGDRLLYLRSPMLRGDDVADLQRSLGALGFRRRAGGRHLRTPDRAGPDRLPAQRRAHAGRARAATAS